MPLSHEEKSRKLTMRRARLSLSLAASALIVVIVTPMFYSAPYGLLYHRGCVGSPAENVTLSTPVFLVDSPYGGNATARAVTSTGPGGTDWDSVSVSNGQTAGVFTLDKWELYRESEGNVPGPGLTTECTAPYQAADLSRGGGSFSGGVSLHSALLSSENLTNDSAAYSTVTLGFLVNGIYQTFPSVVFNLSFSTSNLPPIHHCGPTFSYWNYSARSDRVEVLVPFVVGYNVVLVPVTLPESIQYAYLIPAGSSGVYSVQDRSNETGNGLSFSWVACP
jgi:hypothetical protein